jgi:hypothetical protein
MLGINPFSDNAISALTFATARDNPLFSTEAIVVDDANTNIFAYVASAVEDIQLDDSSFVLVDFVGSLTENINIADPTLQQTQFSGSVTEAIVVLDVAIQRGWIKINDSQNANWTDIDNTQG